MIHLHHEGTVTASPAQMWEVTGDPARIGQCFPGAGVTMVDGAAYEGVLSVGIGPLTVTYLGQGRVEERNDAARTCVYRSGGHAKHGLGGADIVMRIGVSEVADPQQSLVTINTEVEVRGLPTPLGSGLAQAISDPLIEHFLRCLADPECPGTGGPDDRFNIVRAVLPGVASYAGRLLRLR